ncbi:DoxX family membrane protein [Gordonia neofelifaecis]|uniref:DoxX family protein n=1 Tax=Gordonia neofelifaecis NRRL B-59395 TaxID=644548 RepID=F1YJN4_9ACTN|nr:DoxX family protein [Gordonia neofelifaecis]EGD54966.1 DoxX family protein [Gordonia neofelifaecis NRRL B-59395]
MKLLQTAGRAMTGLPYMVFGYQSATEPGGRVAAAAPLLDRIRQAVPIPVDNETVVRANGAAQAVGGAMVATGLGRRAGAAMIAASLVPTTVAGHAFWEYEDPMQRKLQETQFLKNLVMLGGVVAIAASAGRK